MSGVGTEVIIVLILIVANGVFAMAEAAIVASRKARLQQAAQLGDLKARVALDLAESPNRFLSTVQIGITLIGIFSGAFGGATLSKALSAQLSTIPSLAPYADSIGLGVVVAIITYLSLIIGELVPKRLALQSPEKIAMMVAVPMRLLSTVAGPLVTLMTFSSDTVLRLLGSRESGEPSVTEEEIKVMVSEGTRVGVFAKVEQDIIERVFQLGDRRVSSIMTPRPDIIWLDAEDTVEANCHKIQESVYSRLPVCRGDLDEVIGIIRAKDLLNQYLKDQKLDLFTNLQPPIFVPETLPALQLLEKMNQGRTHIALVIDEHGTLQGMVTLHDILSAVVGTLPSVDESDEARIIQREDGSWLIDGGVSIEDVKAIIKVDSLPGEQTGNYSTLGGLILMELGRVPISSEYIIASGWRFEVLDMDGFRIDKVLVTAAEHAHETLQEVL
jgi:putative hemolysin